MTQQIAAQRALVAKKTGVSVDKLVGPFKGTHKPTREGLFIRIHSKTGNPNWAHFSTVSRCWGLFSGQKRNALRKANKPSKQHDLVWYGLKG